MSLKKMGLIAALFALLVQVSPILSSAHGGAMGEEDGEGSVKVMVRWQNGGRKCNDQQ